MGLPILWFAAASFAYAQTMNVLQSIAGGNTLPFPSNGPATSAAILSPNAIAVDTNGNVFFGDSYFHQIFKVSPAGTMSLIAGTGGSRSLGDGDKAVNASFGGPTALAIDAQGNLYLADQANYVIRQISPSGIINTYAGNPNANPGSGINGPAAKFGFGGPDGLATDAAGNLYVADNGPGSRTILKINASNQTVSQISGMFGLHGPVESGPALNTALTSPYGIGLDSIGNIFFVDQEYCGVYEITTAQSLFQVAGSNGCSFTGDGSATGEKLNLPTYLAVAGAPANIYVDDEANQRIRVIASNRITTIAGTGVAGYNGDGIPATGAQIDQPGGVAADNAGNVYFTESGGHRVRKIDTQGNIHTIAGVGANLPVGDNGQATSAILFNPSGLVSDGKGTFYVADEFNSTIRKIAPNGIITTLAGTGIAGYNGDNIPAAKAQLNQPFALLLDSQGNLYFSDTSNERIRMINSQGIIETIAGTGVSGYNGENIPATQAQLATPRGITFDAKGNLYVAEADNHRIRVISNGIISTVAGVNGQYETVPNTDSGDGQAAFTANFVFPWGVAIDKAGNIYTADEGSNRVRKIGTDGIIRAFAGQTYVTLGSGTGGDGGASTNSILDGAYQVAVDSSGDVYISGGNRIREVTPDGIIHTPIGGGSEGPNGNGQIATDVSLGTVHQVWPAPDGTVYFTALGNSSIFRSMPGQISREGVQNVADFSSPGLVSPGEIVVLYGNQIGPATLTAPAFTASSTAFPTTIAGTQVMFDGTPAPLLYVESGVIALCVPFEIAGQNVTHMQVMVNGTPTNEVDMPVGPYEPAMWPSIINSDGTVNSPSNPAKSGEVVSFFITGGGLTSPTLSDGQFVNDAMHVMTGNVQLIIGNDVLPTVVYAGAAPGSVAGQMQIVVQLPVGGTTGSAVKLIMLVGGVPVTPLTTTIAIQ